MAYTNSGGDPISSIFSALGADQAPDIQSRPLSQQAEPLYNQLFTDYSKYGKNAANDLDSYRSQLQGLAPQLTALGQANSATYGDLLKKANSYDPTANLKTSGDYLYGQLGKFLNQGLDYGRANQNRSLALQGYGDRPASAYSTILDSNRFAGNLGPLFSGITNALVPLGQQQQQGYFQNLANYPGYMQGQFNSVLQAPQLTLDPSMRERANLLANLDSLNKVTAGQLSNRYFYNKPNWMTQVGDVGSGIMAGTNNLLDTVGHAASTYSSVMGGGMGGGSGISPNSPAYGQRPDLSGGSSLNAGQFPNEISNFYTPPQSYTLPPASPYSYPPQQSPYADPNSQYAQFYSQSLPYA